MKSTAHKLTLDQVDACVESVRQEQVAKAALANATRAKPQRTARGAASRGEAAPNLDLVTLKNTDRFSVSENIDIPFALWDGSEEANQYEWVPDALYDDAQLWRINHYMYSSGVCEIRASLGNPPARKQVSLDSLLITTEESELVQEKRFRSSIERSRRTLRMRATELAADHLLTLTKRGKFDSIDAFWVVWKRFCRLCEIRFKNWKFVVVPEQHKDGTYHAHVALQGYYSIEALRICWYKALGAKGNERGEDTPGSVNIKRFHKPRRGGSGASCVRAIASYISKYVGKGFGASSRGRRLFAAARGLHPNRVIKRLCYHVGGIPELAAALLGELFRAGASGDGQVFRWDRVKRNGELQMCGFILSTEWSARV